MTKKTPDEWVALAKTFADDRDQLRAEKDSIQALKEAFEAQVTDLTNRLATAEAERDNALADIIKLQEALEDVFETDEP